VQGMMCNYCVLFHNVIYLSGDDRVVLTLHPRLLVNSFVQQKVTYYAMGDYYSVTNNHGDNGSKLQYLLL